MYRSRCVRAARVVVGDITRLHAQGWRKKASCAEIAYSRIATSQSSGAGSSISPTTRSTMPSTRSPLLATWLYSDIASTPSARGELAHRERLDPALIRKGDRGLKHALPAERDAGL